MTPTTVYAGLSYDNTHPLYGVYKSVDGGNTWNSASNGLPANCAVYGLVIDPSNPSTLYAGLLAANGVNNNMFKSTDGGNTWIGINNGLRADVSIWSLAIDPLYPSTIYAGTDNGAGVFKSTNGGNSWTSIGTIPATAIWALAVDPATSSNIYAGTDTAGVYKSTNGGNSWSSATGGSSGMPGGLGIGAIAINPVTPSTVFAAVEVVVGMAASLYKSTDSGVTWVATAGVPSGSLLHALAIDPVTTSNVYAGVFGGGVYLSTDGGNNFISINNGLTDPLVHTIAIATTTPTTHYAGTCNTGVFVEQPGSAPPVTVALSPTTIAGGNSVTGTVTLNNTAGGTVTLASSSVSTATVPATVTVTAGSSTANFNVTTFAVQNGTTVTISATFAGSTQQTNLYVTPDLSSLALNPALVVGGNGTTGTVSLAGTAPYYASVSLTSSNTAAATVPLTVTIPTGATSVNFAVSTSGVATSQSATITANYNGSITSTTLTVNPATLSTLTLNPTSVVGGASSTGTVTLNGAAAPSNGAQVSLSSSNQAAATVPQFVTVTAGATQASFQVTTNPVNSSTSSIITATFNGQSATPTLTITTGPTITGLSPGSAIAGGAGFTLTVNGTNFVSGASVQWGGNPLPTTVLSGTQVTATVSASLIASAGTATITVTTSAGTSGSATFTITPGVSGGGVGYITSVGAQSTDGNTASSVGVDTTGANLIVAGCMTVGNSASEAFSDSQNGNSTNTYTKGVQTATSGWSLTIWYAYNPAHVGPNHVFKCSESGASPSIKVIAFSGAITTDPKDGIGAAHDTASNSASCKPGSITASQSGDIFFTMAGNDDTRDTTLSVDSSFTAQATQVATATGTGGNSAYWFDTGTSTVNLTWTSNFGNDWQKCAAMAFKTH